MCGWEIDVNAAELTNDGVTGYSFRVTAQSVAGISLLNSERTGAHSKRLFCARVSMAGVMGALRSADPRIRKANPVAPATHSVALMVAVLNLRGSHHV